MLRALYSSAAGMQSQQVNLDVIANNLANVNTTGYKRTKAEFQDLLYQTDRAAGAQQGNNTQVPTGIQIGHGSRLISTAKVFTTGELTQTGEKLDLAIQGDGFFEVQMPDGTRAFTRDGALKTDNTGRITTNDGLPLLNGFQPIPPGTTAVTISPNGEITTKSAGGTQNFQVQLVRFANPAGLESLGRNLYKETPASGAPEIGNPGDETLGIGTLQQGYLELSNVEVVKEMVNMIMAQRAYEVNSRAVQASDEMMQMSNNLRR